MISIREFDFQFIQESAKITSQFTIQILRLGDKGHPVAHGTGVLFEFDKKNYLLTAGHNFINEDIKELLIASSSGITSLDGHFYYNKNIDDVLDFAIVILEETLVEDLKKAKSFVNLDKIQLHHKQKLFNDKDITKSRYYKVIGFPGTGTKPKYGTKDIITANLFYFTGYLHYNRKRVNTLKTKFHSHLFLDRHNKIIQSEFNQKIEKPILKGMSGCGIWDIQGYDIDIEKPILKLVGIFIESKYNILIFTKIDIFINFLKHNLNVSKLP